jgi:hypothetical protein
MKYLVSSGALCRKLVLVADLPDTRYQIPDTISHITEAQLCSYN